MTTERISTKDAYKLALQLSKEGMTTKNISKELARRGYVSFKTGRKLLPQSVYCMSRLAAQGKFPKTHKQPSPKRDKSHLYRPRGPRKVALSVEQEATAQNIAETAVTAARAAFNGAYKDIEELANKHTNIAKALTTLLEAVH